MKTIEDLNEIVKTVSDNNLKYGEIHTAYFDSVTKRLGEGYTELAEDSKTYLDKLARVNSFSEAFKTQMTFEDAAKAKLIDLHNTEIEAAKMLQEDLAKLVAINAPVSSVKKAAAKATKPTVKA